MADITKYLDDIKSAVYGKDVRDSIHDSIQAINNQVENSETSAANSAADAEKSRDDALASSIAAGASESASENYKKLSQSYAVGGTGERIGEDSDNAKYYKEQAELIVSSVTGSLRPMGTIAFENLPLSPTSGDMYNISDEFVTDERFKEGEGLSYPAGTNVYYTYDGYWDCLAGDLSKLITAVAEIKTAVEQTESDMSGMKTALNNIVSDKYDPTKAYAIGEYCIKDDTLQKRIVDIEEPEEFNAEHWKQTSVDSEFVELNSNLNDKVQIDKLYGTPTNVAGFSVDLDLSEYEFIIIIFSGRLQPTVMAKPNSIVYAGMSAYPYNAYHQVTITTSKITIGGLTYYPSYAGWDTSTSSNYGSVQGIYGVKNIVDKTV